jgi:hypothetical protein
METAVFLARAWGLYILLICISLMITKKSFIALLKKLQYDVTVVFTGAFVLLLGVLQVVAYDDWSFSWRGLITLLGWLTVLKGLFVLYPGYVEKFGKHAIKEKSFTITVLIGLIIGVYLLYVGYVLY